MRYTKQPLLNACRGQNQDTELIGCLITKGADINAQLDRGLTALHFAAMSGNLKVASFLIEHGIDLNVHDWGCYGTPLHTAISLAPNPEMAKLLIESGADIDRKFSFGNTALHLAVVKGYADLAQFLVEHGADINVVNEYNHSAVYYAAKLGYRSTVDSLIAMGANKSDIVETNYGKAPQLTKKLKAGKAYLWHLDGLYGGGYAVKTKEHLIIFDKTDIDESPEAGLANGHLNPNELTGQKIIILITKPLHGRYKSGFFELAKQIPDIDYVIESRPIANDANNPDLPPHHLAVPNESFSVDDIQVHTIPAAGRGYGGAKGLGYLVETDGVKIFHAGFHASANQASQNRAYRKEIDFLKSFGPIDIAFLSIAGHLSVNYEAYLYLIDQLRPKAIYLIGGDQVTEQYPRCAEVLRARNIPVKYPEGGIALGERFHYLRDGKNVAQGI